MTTTEQLDGFEDVDPGWVCPEPECNGRSFKTENHLNIHRDAKHNAGGRSAPRRSPGRPRKIPRGQKLEGSLSVLVLGLGVMSPAMGAIWTPSIPPIANALDACANEYKWARTLVDTIENAGPISLLLAALAPPLLQTFMHFGLLPANTAAVINRAGGMSAPPSPQPEGRMNEDGSVDMNVFGMPMHFSAADVAAAASFANQQAANARGAQSTVTEVPLAG